MDNEKSIGGTGFALYRTRLKKGILMQFWGWWVVLAVIFVLAVIASLTRPFDERIGVFPAGILWFLVVLILILTIARYFAR